MSEPLHAAVKKIEETYETIQTLVNKMINLEKTVNDLSEKSKTYVEKYEALVNGEELKKMKETTGKSIDKAMENLVKINESLAEFTNAKYLLNEELQSTLTRINKIDENFNRNIKRMNNIDKTLLSVSTKVDKERVKSDKHLIKAKNLYEILSQEEDFKSLKTKVEENNRLLKQLLNQSK